MTGTSFGRLLLAGFRARWLLTLGSLILAVVGIGSAVLGPLYQDAATNSFLVARLQTTEPFLSGLTWTLTPSDDLADDPAAAERSARTTLDGTVSDVFAPAETTLLSLPQPIKGGEARLLSRAAACEHLDLEGRCPGGPDEVAIWADDAGYAGLAIGDEIDVGVAGRMTIVGTYTVPPDEADFWFDPSRLTSVHPIPDQSPPITYQAAPYLTTQEAFDDLPASSWVVLGDRRLRIAPTTTVADLTAAADDASSLPTKPYQVDDGTLALTLGNQLGSVRKETLAQQQTARRSVAPAVLSLILVAIALQLRLMTAAADQRRSELSLASLRGLSSRRMWVLGLAEPLTILLVALPIGVIAGVAAARAFATTWLVDGLAVNVDGGALWAPVVVAAVSALVAVIAVRQVLREPLASQLAGVRRPRSHSAAMLVVRLVVVAAAVVLLVSGLTSPRQSAPEPSDLALPIVLALGAGLVMTDLTAWVARRWADRTERRRGVAAFVASRLVSRRREGALVILPLTAALAIAVFSIGVYNAAADWRFSNAVTQAGSGQSYRSPLTMDDTVELTHELDPDGRWLMAAAAEGDPKYGDRLILDTPRLGAVATWPGNWTAEMDGGDVQKALAPAAPPIELKGTSFELTVDNGVSEPGGDVTVGLRLRPASGGAPQTLYFSQLPAGESTSTVQSNVCTRGCEVVQLDVSDSDLGEAADGTVEIVQLRVDGEPIEPSALDGDRWREVPPLAGSDSQLGSITDTAGRLTLELLPPDGQLYAAVSPDDVPLARPILVGRGADLSAAATGAGGELVLPSSTRVDLHADPVAATESMPFLGPRGIVIDYTMVTRDANIQDANTSVYVMSRADTPEELRRALAARGLTAMPSLAEVERALSQDAYALALNLYLVVAATVVLLAVAGLGVSTVVQLADRRRDAASLRVVGVSRTSIIRAVGLEFVVVLGGAGLAAVAAGCAAVYVVVRNVRLGYVDGYRVPRLLNDLDVWRVAELVAVVLVVMTIASLLVGWLTVRSSRGAILRDDSR